MTKEQIYTEQLKALGIWEEAFKPEVHELAVMERELTRMLKAWKAEDASDPTSKTFATICSMRRDILAHRDALGLTPKALQRLRGKMAADSASGSDPFSQKLDALVAMVGAYE